MAAPDKTLPETASQTAGPYVHIGLMPDVAGIVNFGQDIGKEMIGPATPGIRVVIEGQIFDGVGDLVRDAVIEVSQLDAEGRAADAAGAADGFRGWGRFATDFQTGLWRCTTVLPGTAGEEAPHLSLWLVARGINIGLHTRLYFSDLVAQNARCPVLRSLPAERRHTLLANRDGGVYRFDIQLQGANETAFFDI